MSDTAGGNDWREAFPVKMLAFKGYDWIDTEERGTLAHAFEAFPRDMIPTRIRSLCDRRLAGPISTSVSTRRACAACIDLIERAKLRSEDAAVRERMQGRRRR